MPIHQVILYPGGPHDLPALDLAQDGDRQAIISGLPVGVAIDDFLNQVPTLEVLLS